MPESTLLPFTFVSDNIHKINLLEKILKTCVNHQRLALDEIQSMDSLAVAAHKAKQAWLNIGTPVLIWDQSLHIDCLNGFPGPLVKWFWETVSLKKICDIVSHYENRSLHTTTTLAYYDGLDIQYFTSSIYGGIPAQPRGANGFSWDAIFIPNDYQKTFAEMTANEKEDTGVHRIAIENFKCHMQSYA